MKTALLKNPPQFEYPFKITKASQSEAGDWMIEGFAATSDFDLQGDIITEEAMKECADDLLERSTVLFNHDENQPIGAVQKVEVKKDEDQTGLWILVKVSKAVPEIWQRIKEGILNKFSIRGKILEAKKEYVKELKRVVNIIRKMTLVEVSLVSVPANARARALSFYVSKALEKYEAEGGDIMLSEQLRKLLEKANVPVIELPEAKAFPGVQELVVEFGEYLKSLEKQPETEEEHEKTWGLFCGENGYAVPVEKALVDEILALLDKVIEGVEDDELKNLLMQIKALVIRMRAAYPKPYPYPYPKPASQGGKSEDDDDNPSLTDRIMNSRFIRELIFRFGTPKSADGDSKEKDLKVTSEDIELLKELINEQIREKGAPQDAPPASVTATIDYEAIKSQVEGGIAEAMKTAIDTAVGGLKESLEAQVGETLKGLDGRIEKIEKQVPPSQAIEGQDLPPDKPKSVFKGVLFKVPEEAQE